jgi:hypothetical protein
MRIDPAPSERVVPEEYPPSFHTATVPPEVLSDRTLFYSVGQCFKV